MENKIKLMDSMAKTLYNLFKANTKNVCFEQDNSFISANIIFRGL